MTAFIEYKDGGDAISTHTPLVRRDLAALDDAGLAVISTHTPLVRRDQSAGIAPLVSAHFNSHASCEA